MRQENITMTTNNLSNSKHYTGQTILTLEFQVMEISSFEYCHKFSAHAMVLEREEQDLSEQLSR